MVHDRYADLGLRERGEVQRVYDPILERTVAMKIQLSGWRSSCASTIAVSMLTTSRALIG